MAVPNSSGIRSIPHSLEACSLDRPKVSDELPALRFGQARPGRHAVGQVALAEEPLEVAVGRRFDVVAAQGRPFAAVAHGIGAVALLAVLSIDEGAGSGALRAVGEGVDADVLFGRNALPTRAGRGTEHHGGAHDQKKNCKASTNHCAPP